MANSTADGSVVIDVDMNVSQANKQLAKLKQNIEKSEREISETQKKLDAARQKSLIDVAELDAEKAKLAEMREKLEEIRRISTDKTLAFSVRDEAKAGIPDMRSAIAEQQQRVNMLQAEWNKTENAVSRYEKKISDATAKLEQQQTEAGVLTERIMDAEKAQNGMSVAINRADAALGKFSSRIGKLASRVFVFTMITSALRSMRSWLGKAIKTNEQASASIAKLKGALLTLAQPIVQVIIPAFTALINAITTVVSAIASVVSFIFGTTADESARAAENLYGEQKALGGVGAAAKKAGKQLANFDEINKLSSEDAGGGGGGGMSAGIEPNFDNSFIKDELDAIAALMGTALLAVGAILTFSGANVPLGLGLMAVGAVMLGSAIMANWDSISQMLQGPLGAIAALLGASLLVVGAVLAFSGANIPLGLALMVMGALSLAGAIAANWDTLSSVLQGPIGVITALLSGALLVIGAIIAFSGANIGLGIGLMILGAVGLAATVAANWNAISDALQGPIGVVTALVSAALIVLGAIFTFTGANLPLGIALMMLGAAGLATTAAVNWGTIQTALQGPIGTITAILSAALLVIGGILAFSGAALPLGIGLMVVGAIGLAASIAANWNFMVDALGGPIGAVAAIVSGALLVLGVILLFTGAGIPLGLGLILTGAAGLAVVVAPNWDFIKDAIMGAYNSMIEWWNGTASKFFTLEYWANLANDMLDGLFGGLKNLGRRISDWGSSFIAGVKDFFGIHSPSTEFEGLGFYMMSGLEIGVNENTEPVVYAFSLLFSAVTALCTQNMDLMQLSINALLIYFMTQFIVEWEKGWFSAYQSANANINLIIAGLNTMTNSTASAVNRMISYLNQLEAKLRVVLALMGAVGAGGGSSASGYSGGMGARIAAMPAIAQADIPHLARGAVIPPNREFMAVLGDQKSGTNIETPLDTMVQAFRQALSQSGINAGRSQTVILQVDRRELGRVVYEVNNEETQVIGVNFAEVVRA